MKEIIFFDIDRTLYDYRKFLEKFYKRVVSKFNLSKEQKSDLRKVYNRVKQQYGYFAPDKFLEPILQKFTFIDKTSLTEIFWDKKMFEDNLYQDSDALFDIAKVVTIGIFSKGEKEFQEEKITPFKNIIKAENVHVFLNKIENIANLINQYKGFKIYMVDDHLEVLIKVKELDSSIFTIYIEREKKMDKSDTIDAEITNLNQVLDLIK